MKKKSRHDHDHIIPHQGDAAELAARLAPPEEGDKKAASQASNNGGAILVDTANVKIAEDFTEKQKRAGLLGMDSIALVILIFSLAFIALITYLIWIEPPKTGEAGAQSLTFIASCNWM